MALGICAGDRADDGREDDGDEPKLRITKDPYRWNPENLLNNEQPGYPYRTIGIMRNQKTYLVGAPNNQKQTTDKRTTNDDKDERRSADARTAPCSMGSWMGMADGGRGQSDVLSIWFSVFRLCIV
jgi:hypothetical protein